MTDETAAPTPHPEDQPHGRPKGTCAGCGRLRHLRKGGTVGAHNKLTPQGYNIGTACSGVDQPPVEVESVR